MKIFISIFLILALGLSLTLGVDESALSIQDAAFERAMIAFGLAKGLNAVISLIQGTELSFTPVGVGLNFSVGEVLDPFNDMVERFSWVMLLATVSLGIQKILLVLSSKIFIQVVLILSVGLSLLFIWVKQVKNSLFLSYSLKLFILMLLLRFSAIVFVFISQELYTSTLEAQYVEASSVIENTKVELEEFQSENKIKIQDDKCEIVNGKNNGSSSWNPINKIQLMLMESKDYISDMNEKIKNNLNVSDKLDSLQSSIDNASRKIITLITIFIMQSVVMPLLFLWMLVISVKLIFRSEFTFEQLNRVYNS